MHICREERSEGRNLQYKHESMPYTFFFSVYRVLDRLIFYGEKRRSTKNKFHKFHILKFHHQNNFRWFIHFFTLFISFKILLLFIICVQYFFLCYYCYHSTFCTKNQNNVIYWKKFEEQSLLTLPIYIRGIVCDLETLERVFALED